VRAAAWQWPGRLVALELLQREGQRARLTRAPPVLVVRGHGAHTLAGAAAEIADGSPQGREDCEARGALRVARGAARTVDSDRREGMDGSGIVTRPEGADEAGHPTRCGHDADDG